MDVYPCLLICSLLLKLFLKKSFVVKLMFDISNEISTKTIKRLYYYSVAVF
nr:hypothetical protein [uncultured bacterium]